MAILHLPHPSRKLHLYFLCKTLPIIESLGPGIRRSLLVTKVSTLIQAVLIGHDIWQSTNAIDHNIFSTRFSRFIHATSTVNHTIHTSMWITPVLQGNKVVFRSSLQGQTCVPLYLKIVRRPRHCAIHPNLISFATVTGRLTILFCGGW